MEEQDPLTMVNGQAGLSASSTTPPDPESVVVGGLPTAVLTSAQLAHLMVRDCLAARAEGAAWRPRLATEVDHKTIPHELDWLRTAVHLHKGCYRGQETVARVHNMGRPPRRLVMAHLDGSGHLLPEIGASVEAGDRSVGVVTSVARSRARSIS